jgi:2-octaprenyl-6-methoxyphenol hydroxylase
MTHPIEVAVAIIGAGPVGASLAIALADAGIPTAVIDSAPLPPMEAPAFDGRAYAIAAASRRFLDAAGIWDALPAPTNPIRRIHVADGRPGEPASPLTLTFDARRMAAEPPQADAPFGWMVEARHLRMALNARMAALPALRVFAPARATTRRDAGGATIQLDSGEVLKARLLVGAEGRNSPSRLAAGIGAPRLDYRQMGLVGAIAHELPHEDGALEKFLPDGPFAQLPMAATPGHPHVSAIVWSDRTAIAQAALKLDDAAYGRQIQRRLGDHLGKVTPIGRRWSYPLSAMQALRYVDTRLALVGDAAHGMHPIAGQGLNIGFRDAAALAGLLRDAPDPGAAAVLARYQAARRPDGMMMIGATHALERLFGNDLPPLRLARRLGIAAVDRMPGVKRFFAMRAMGVG